MGSRSFSILIVGTPGSIEGPLVNAFINKTGDPYDNIPTIFDPYPVKIRGKECRCYFTLVGNNEQNLDSSLGSSFDTILLHFSLSDRVSLNEILIKWYPDIMKRSVSPIILIGINDITEERIKQLKSIGDVPVTNDEALEAARKVNAIKYFEVKIENRSGIEEAFGAALKACSEKKNKSCIIV